MAFSSTDEACVLIFAEAIVTSPISMQGITKPLGNYFPFTLSPL
jgi:hypothetical protein